MNILSAERISKSYSEKILFDNISLGISEGEKIGLIGVNGTGKSTLLKVIAGVENSDSGRIIKGNSIRMEYLPQNPEFEDGITVLEQVLKGSSPVMKLLRDYEYTLQKYNENPDSMQLEKKLLALTQEMDNLGAWTLESEVKTILTKLGIFDYAAEVGVLSGGQRKRTALAGTLINSADLMILDEPTNHLDNSTVDWLENYLNNRKGALLMVTHDRYFLDRVANRIIELDNGKLYSYQANYSKFLEMKAEREELEQSSERKRQNLLRNELEWIRRGAKARSTKQKARIERFEKLQEIDGPSAAGNIEIKVGAARLGKKVIELERVSKSFSDDVLIDDFSYILSRDDRVGIIGPNGIGKSTLLKIIAGKLSVDSGKVEIGETVKVGFFSQEGQEMDENLRVIEYIREAAEYITTKDGTITASQMLETFLFPPAAQWTPIAKLSGGERRRLYLLRVLMGEPNILLLDEPTNDLDIQTLTILESYLDEYPGAVIAVSHDRYFLDRVVSKIFSFEGGGVVRQYTGSYSDYSGIIRSVEPGPLENRRNTDTDKGKNNNTESIREKPLKFTFKEQKEFEQIDGIIEALENELKEINSGIVKASSDYTLLEELLTKKELAENRLNEAMERWEYLNELAEKIACSKKQVGTEPQ